MRIFIFLFFTYGALSASASECLYKNDLHGLTPIEFIDLINSGKKPMPAIITLKTWIQTTPKNQGILSSYVRILSTDCILTALYQGEDGQYYPVSTSRISAPFGDIYSLYADAVKTKNTTRISWLYKYTLAKPKSLGAYLKLWRLTAPAETGGLEIQRSLIQIFKATANYKPKTSDIVDQTARNWSYTGTLDDFNFAKLFKAWGGVVLPDCGSVPLPAQFEVVTAVGYKRPYQGAIDLLAEMQNIKVIPIEGHSNLIKIPLESDAQIQVDFSSCVAALN